MKNNKGFSLVELIIVIAIMAVLIGVLAPQYLRYVEKSKKQADLSAVGQVYDALRVACSDPEMQKPLRDSTLPAEISIADGGWSVTGGTLDGAITTDLNDTVKSDSIKLTSTTYGGSTFKVTISSGNNGYVVSRDTAWEGVMENN
jgi:type IV pilus assembly protein PilA